MKKIILILAFLFVSFSPTYSYDLSSSDTIKVESAADTINAFIERKGEKYRPILLDRIDAILKRDISDKNIAIFTLLRELLADSLQVESILEEIIDDSIDSSDMSFTFSSEAHRCSSNPCETSESFVKIEGIVSNSLIKYVEVNDYRLNSYQGSVWEYNPNVAYSNFTDGENTYVINYLSADFETLFTQEFVINKLAPEVIVVEEEEIVETIEQDQTSEVEESEESSSSVESYSVDTGIPYVDEDEVREYWRDLLNEERTLLGLSGYTYDKSLDATAKIWSDMAVSRGYIDHKVDSPSDSYYDYWKKAEWMEDNGVVCENVSRATFSESIAWNNYYCSDTSTCTDQLKSAVKRTYDFYMSEKGTDYDPHYRAIAHVNFETMGLGISVANLGNGGYKMYLTNHYCTTNTK